jgi:hypothetical protein
MLAVRLACQIVATRSIFTEYQGFRSTALRQVIGRTELKSLSDRPRFLIDALNLDISSITRIRNFQLSTFNFLPQASTIFDSPGAI